MKIVVKGIDTPVTGEETPREKKIIKETLRDTHIFLDKKALLYKKETDEKTKDNSVNKYNNE